MIRVDKIKKSFGSNNAVKEVSFDVSKGEIFGLLGPNGAGKSTTIKMLVTILKADSGTASINGFDIIKDKKNVRKSVGIIFQDPSLDERLTAEENLYFHSKLYHVPPKEIKERIENALKLVDLLDRKDDLVLTFSGGMKRRLEIARGIVHTPHVLFLDEPTIGLDPQTRKHIWEYLVNLRDKHRITMLLTTHYMEEAEICDRIAIMDNGKIIALDTPDKLKKSIQNDIVTLITDNNIEMLGIIKEKFNITGTIDKNAIIITVPDGRTFLPKLIELGEKRIISVDIKKPSLEDVFIKLTGKTIRDEESNARDRLKDIVRRRRRR